MLHAQSSMSADNIPGTDCENRRGRGIKEIEVTLVPPVKHRYPTYHQPLDPLFFLMAFIFL